MPVHDARQHDAEPCRGICRCDRVRRHLDGKDSILDSYGTIFVLCTILVMIFGQSYALFWFQHSGLTMGVRVRMRVRMEDELGLRVRGESDEGE